MKANIPTRWKLFLNAFVAGVLIASAQLLAADVQSANATPPRNIEVLYNKLPISFLPVERLGKQRFVAQGAGFSLEICGAAAEITLVDPPGATNRSVGTPRRAGTSSLEFHFVGGTAPSLRALYPLPGKFNYFVGNRPADWRTSVTQYEQVHAANVYPGIDVIWHGDQRQVEYDLVVSPGADPNLIHLRINGAQSLTVAPNGDLLLTTASGTLVQHHPHVYQLRGGHREEVTGGYVVQDDNEVVFQIGSYEPSIPLTIDPTLSYATLWGGNSDDAFYRVAVDQQGYAYLTGYTYSTNIPGIGPNSYQRTLTPPATAAFVTKLNPSVTGAASLIFSTYLTGGSDTAYGIKIDPTSGNIWVVGGTYSSSFPVTSNAYQRTLSASEAVFLSELNSAGTTLVYSTLIQGPNLAARSEGRGIAVDSAGSVYLAGFTGSASFPTTAGAVQSCPSNGVTIGFMMKFNPSTGSPVYSTCLGGTGSLDATEAKAVAIDSSGNAYLTGYTTSTTFPTTGNAAQFSYQGGNQDAFVAKINPNAVGAASLVYSTYLGGIYSDEAKDIFVDAFGFAYVTGYTQSTNFPTTGNSYRPRQPSGDSQSAFLAKIDSGQSGTASLIYSTFLGGSFDDVGYGLVVDASQTAWVVGSTNGTDVPTTANAYKQRSGVSDSDAFLVAIDTTQPGTASLAYGTYYGGTDNDAAYGVVLDTAGSVLFVGTTSSTLGSTNFPTTSGAFQAADQGGLDGFFVKFANSTAPVLNISKSHSGTFTQGQTGAAYSVLVNNAGTGPTSGTVTVTETPPSGLTVVSMSGTGWNCSNTTCTRSDVLNPGISYPSITVSVNVAGNAASPQINQASVAGGGSTSSSTMDSTTVLTSSGLPDLVVSALTGLNSGNPGGSITGSTTVLNQGSGSAGAFQLEFYFSPTSTPSLGSAVDTRWGCPFTSLAPGASLTCSGSIGVPASLTPGTWYLAALADSNNQVAESNENNNWRISDSGPVILGPALKILGAGSNGYLYSIVPTTGTTTLIGTLPTVMSDIAAYNGALYGISSGTSILYRIDPNTAVGTVIGTGTGVALNALVFNSSGTLYAAGGDSLYTINTTSGSATLVGGGSGSGVYVSSGDLEFDYAGNLYLTSSGPSGDQLFSLNPATGQGTLIGNIGSSSVFGLTYYNSTAYGFTLGGQVITINLATGAGSLIASYTPGFNGTTVFAPSVAALTIQTIPSGLLFSVDGGAVQTAPQNLNLSQGTHTIAVATTQSGGTGTQYMFTGWSDGGAASHTITVTGTAATYTASFKTQYQLATSASPVSGGTVTPVSGTFYDAGTVVPITATANAGYTFNGWTGPVANSGTASTTATVSAPLTVIANFLLGPNITIQTNPSGRQFSVDGGAPQTAPQTLSLSQGTHTIAVATTQGGAAGTQYVFTGWSDGGAASHSITVGASSATYTASFKTQYQLTISASPTAGGTVTPASGAFYDAGTVVPISATANAGYTFSGWTGTVANASNASTTVAMSAAETITASFSGRDVTLTMGNNSGPPGGTVTAPISIASVGTLPANFQTDIHFDTTKLSVNSNNITPGTQATAAGKTVAAATLSNGDVRVVVTGLNTNMIANGSVVNVPFGLSTQFAAGGSAPVTLLNCSSSDAAGNTLPTSCVAGTIMSEPRCDLNGDGQVTVADVQNLINQVLGLIPAVSDLNRDGQVTVADVQILINVVLGIATCPN